MLHSRWQLAVSDKPIHVNSNLKSCYAAVAAASEPASGTYPATGVYGTPSLRQGGLHVSLSLAATIGSFDGLLMVKRDESNPSRSQAQMGLRKRRRING